MIAVQTWIKAVSDIGDALVLTEMALPTGLRLKSNETPF